MKKLLPVIVFAVLTLGLPIISLAAEDKVITQDTQEKNGNITVDYNAGVTYTVTIPASVTFTDAEKTVERPLMVNDVLLNEGSSLSVVVTSQNGFKMKNGEGYIDYSFIVNYNATPEEGSYSILTVEAGERSGWAILDFTTELDREYALYAGNYTDTLTFTVEVD